jgi:outer membrane protein OmpA-like peptidoglycan-associated protein
MQPYYKTVMLAVVGLLLLAVLPGLVYAQGTRTLTDFRGLDYSAEDVGRALFGSGDPTGDKALGREEPRNRGLGRERVEPSAAQGTSVAPNVFFEFNSDRVLSKYYPDLDKLGQALVQNPGYRLRIEGHTDNIGSDTYNQALSKRRAQSVKQYLVERFRIAPDRLTAEGLGESNPIASNDSPEGREKNRRIEVVNLGRVANLGR